MISTNTLTILLHTLRSIIIDMIREYFQLNTLLRNRTRTLILQNLISIKRKIESNDKVSLIEFPIHTPTHTKTNVHAEVRAHIHTNTNT